MTIYAPADTESAVNSLFDSSIAGTSVGITAAAADPDAGEFVTYSIDDARFDVDPATGVVTRADIGTLDAAAEPSVALTVTATSSDGSTATESFTLAVTQASTVFETRIATSRDDVEETSNGAVEFGSADLELIDDDTKLGRTVGLRFDGIDIPHGATITSAWVQFQVDEADTGAASLLIRGEDVGNAATYAAVKNGVSGRASTEASVLWEPPAWTTIGEQGPDQRSTDISAIIQEIVDRGDWAALNALSLKISGTGERTAEAFDGVASAAPLLHIEFLPPGPPVAFETPPDADPVADSIGELAATGTLVGITAAAADPDAGETVSYGISDSRFTINSDTGVITRSDVGQLDFESQPNIALTVTATSSDTTTATHVFSLGVTDEAESVAFAASPDADDAVNSITEVAGAGTAVGISAIAADTDAGDTVAYSIDDARFDIDPTTGTITRSATGSLDFITEPTITVSVLATSSDASTATQTYDIDVTRTVLTVGDGMEFSTIQQAIDAAVDGDTALVSPGVYTEPLVIENKSIIIASQFYATGNADFIGSTIIDIGGDNDDDPDLVTFDTGSDGSQLIGFTLRNGGDGIVVSAPDISILNNHVSNVSDGIDYKGGGVIGGVARGNIFENNRDDGIDTNNASDVVIEENIIRLNHGDGIEIRLNGSFATTASETINYVIRNNLISYNDSDGIQLIDSPDLSNRYFRIEGNIFDHNRQAGIGLMDNEDTTEDYRAASIPEPIDIIGNTFIGNNYGLTGGDNLVAINNIFVDQTNIAIKGVDGGSIAAHNLFWSNGTDIQTSNVDAPTLIFQDPRLGGDFVPQGGSPAIDIGVDFFAWRGETVLDLAASEFVGSAPDLGAAESGLPSIPKADLELSQTVSDAKPDVGDTVVYSLSLVHAGGDSTTNVTVRDLLPAGVGFLQAAGSQGSYDSVTGVWDIGTMMSGQTVTLDISADVLDLTMPIDNVAEVASSDLLDPDSTPGDGAPGEDDLAIARIGPPPADLSLTQTVSEPHPLGGDLITFSLTLTNAGPGDAAGVEILDLLPEGLIYDPNTSTSHGTYDSVTGIWSAGSIASGQVATLSLAATVDGTPTQKITNSAEIIAANQDDPDSTPGNGDRVEDDWASAYVTPEITAFEARISRGNDDVEQSRSGFVEFSGSKIELVDDGSRLGRAIGLRFNEIDIPKDAQITTAYVQFQSAQGGFEATDLFIRGEDSGNSPSFGGASGNRVTARPETDAEVVWVPPEWTAAGEAGAAQKTPDLAAIIQEIVSRNDWDALNSLSLKVTGSGVRTTTSYESDPSAAALLHVEYRQPSAPVDFDVPSDANSVANGIGETGATGSPVGITASAEDPDIEHTVSYSISDSRFDIDPETGFVTRSGTGTLDFETEPSIALVITATSSDSSSDFRSFWLDIFDDPEPASFDARSDTDIAANRIAFDVAAGTDVGITASASDADITDLITDYSVDDTRFEIDPATGVITRSAFGSLDFLGEPEVVLTVTAISSDDTAATETFVVEVRDTVAPPTSVTLQQTIDTSAWSPSSPDPAGIIFLQNTGELLIADSEVNEIESLFTGDNLFLTDLNGNLTGTLTALGFSDEPTGLAYNPADRHLFISDDLAKKSTDTVAGIYEVDPGLDGLYDTTDDTITFLDTGAFGSFDPEGVAYDTTRDVLHVVDGIANEVFTVDPGANGVFDGVADSGGDDVVTSFDTAILGITDPEGIAYDDAFDFLYITAGVGSIAQVTTTGGLVGLLDISAANALKPAGLTLGPNSLDPDETSLYLVDRGIDNDSHPNENDGLVYEFSFDTLMA